MYGENTDFTDVYYKFLELLPSGKASETFDEDEFIDIFDAAGDLGDISTQFSVLLIALAKYPDSQSLKERQALYHLDQEQYSHALAIANLLPQSSFIGSLVKLQCGGFPAEESAELLPQLVSTLRNGTLDDEEVIRLVKCAWALQCHTWLIDNVGSLKTKCQYPQTLVYESAQVLFQTGDYLKARDFLVELTTIEPFAIEYWSALAETDGEGLHDYQSALQDVEYALAINPTSRKDLLMKIQYSILCNEPADKIFKYLDYAVQSHPTDYELLLFKATVLAKYNKKQEALEILKDNCDNLIDLPLYLEIATDYSGNKFPEWVDDKHLKDYAERLSEEELSEKIDYFRDCEAYTVAIHLLMSYYGEDIVYDSSLMEKLMDLFYLNHDYQQVVDIYKSAQRTLHINDKYDLRIAVLFCISSFNLGLTDGLDEYIEKVLDLDEINAAETIERRTSAVGCRIALIAMRELLHSGQDAHSSADYNPFEL